MDDSKLLSLTSIKLSPKKVESKLIQSNSKPNLDEEDSKPKSRKAERRGSASNSHDSSSDQNQSILSLPYLPMAKRIPTHLFDKRKGKTPYQKYRSRTAWGNESSESGPSKLNSTSSSMHPDIVNSKESRRFETFKEQTMNPNEQLKKMHLTAGLKLKQERLYEEHKLAYRDAQLFRLQIMANVDNMLTNMPLKYMYSKPNLRSYAIERAINIIIQPMQRNIRLALYNGMMKFKEFQKTSKREFLMPYERQVGMMVILKTFSNALERMLCIAFNHWAMLYASRHDKIKIAERNEAAKKIQNWYRHLRIISSTAWQKLTSVMHMCVQRRRAIRYIVQFEMKRLKALEKIRKGIATRRRYYFLARRIQRRYRWVLKFRRVRRKLKRKRCARRIQRWIRKMHKRSKRDLLIIRCGLRCGGPSRIFPKIPKSLQHRRRLDSIEGCIYKIQTWFLRKSGLLMHHLDRVNKEQRNRCASIIQNSYKAYLWRYLLLKMKHNNKARRLQRSMRAYKYRIILRRRIEDKYSRKIQKFCRRRMGLKKLRFLFRRRRIMMVTAIRIQNESAFLIQRTYREYMTYETERRESIRRMIASQKALEQRMFSASSTIQRVWRQKVEKKRFSNQMRIRHERQQRLFKLKCLFAAKRVQRVWRSYISIKKYKEMKRRTDSVNKIIKNYRLYRGRKVLEKKIVTKKRNSELFQIKMSYAARCIQRNFRMFQWLDYFDKRCRIRQFERLRAERELLSATKIQRMFRRKTMEYNTPIRIVARYCRLYIPHRTS